MSKPSRSDAKYWIGPNEFNANFYIQDLQNYIMELEKDVSRLNNMVEFPMVNTVLHKGIEKDGWIDVEDRLPPKQTPIFVYYKNRIGNGRIVKAFYAPRYSVESDPNDESYDEYCDEKDAYFLREGFYEMIDNWGDFTSVFIAEGIVTHWRDFILPPIIKKENQNEPYNKSGCH